MNTSSQPVIAYIPVIHEDEHIVVVNKPNNFLIHHSHYARNINEPTLLELLEKQFGYPLFPVHRLDRKTSGIILLAKNKEKVAIFQDLFTNNQIKKLYYAIIRGFSKEKGEIDSPIKNDDTGIYKEALTYYESIHQVELPIPVRPYSNSRYSLIKLMPQTGRMHQLRKHMNKVSHPIVGDYKYGDRFHNRMFETEYNCDYLFLHAFSLSFTHPITTKPLVIKASFPFDWDKVAQEFNWILP